MAGYIGQVLFCVFMDRDGVKVHKHAKKNMYIYGLLTKCDVKMAGYWPGYWPGLWTETESRSIHWQKMNN